MICAIVPSHGGGNIRRTGQDPPGWSPENEARYSFRNWTQDLLAWSILTTDLDQAQQATSIVLELGGSARELVRNKSYSDLTTGGMIGTERADPVANTFAPLGEENRLSAMTELMNFHRTSGETIGAMI